jgi:DNA polymerase-3 subunit delta'
LHAGHGLELFDRLFELVSQLPNVDWTRVHALCDEIASPAAEQRYELFFELLLDLLSRLIEARTLGEGKGREGAPEERALAARLIGQDRLATWAELWERVAAGKADAQALNLDRKSLILEIFSRLEAAARG